MMKRWMAILATIVGLLMVGGTVTLAQPGGQPPPARSIVRQGAASGGQYQLASFGWQVRGVSAGAGYHLKSAVQPAGTGTPCCCTFLPCVVK